MYGTDEKSEQLGSDVITFGSKTTGKLESVVDIFAF